MILNIRLRFILSLILLTLCVVMYPMLVHQHVSFSIVCSFLFFQLFFSIFMVFLILSKDDDHIFETIGLYIGLIVFLFTLYAITH